MDDKYGEPGRDKLNAWTDNVMSGKKDPQYTFTTEMNMHMTTYKHGDKKDENDIKYFINLSSETFGMKPESGKKKSEDMFMIYDMKNHSMLMLNNEKDDSMAMK